MSIERLSEITQKFIDENAALDELKTNREDEQRKLQELEQDTSIDLDKASKAATKARRSIEDAEFRVNSITNRQKQLRSEIIDAINSSIDDYKQSERDAQMQRRETFEQISQSAEWDAIRKQIKALNALNNHNWDATKRELLPINPDYREAIEIAQELDLWVDEPMPPSEIDYAKSVIDYDRDHDYRGNLIQ